MEHFSGTEEKIVDELIKDIVAQFFSSLDAGQIPDFGLIQKQLAELQAEMGIDNRAEFQHKMSDIFSEIANVAFFELKDGSFKGKITKAIKIVSPKRGIKSIAKVGKVAMGVAYAGGLYASISTLLKWDDLPADKKAQLVLDCMFYGANICKVLANMGSKIDEAFAMGKWDWKLNKIFKDKCRIGGVSEGEVTLISYKKMNCKCPLFFTF